MTEEVYPGYHWNTKKILVVEDDESSTFLLREVLKETGAKIEYTTDGDGAVEYIRNNPETDLILLTKPLSPVLLLDKLNNYLS